jgi:hypothetical protein
MKKITLLIICALFITNISAQNLIGAWERYYKSNEGKELKSVVIFSNGFQSISTYELETGKFIKSSGGSWELNGINMTETIEFDTQNEDRVGSKISFKIKFNNSRMTIIDNDITFTKIDDGSPGELNGAWLMAGRVRDGEKRLRNTDGPRKTMKILSGTRFQWIAYNTESKKFMGTGGGTYETKNGMYKENIEFFSRDDSKSGLQLNFNFSIKGNEWNHKGFSSKGVPLHEIWIYRE